MIQLLAMLIKKVALEVIIRIPLQSVHVIHRVVVLLRKSSPRLARDMHPLHTDVRLLIATRHLILQRHNGLKYLNY